jgi:hypothetical protein
MGHDLKLHVVGDAENVTYREQIRRLCEAHAGWIDLEGRLSGAKKARVLAGNAFGLHGCEGDAFPGAVIEMMQAGCITWVHNSGGQPDIVSHPGLTYESVEDAVRKIDLVLKDKKYRATLLEHVQNEAKRFSIKRFQEGFRALVAEFHNRNGMH